MKGNLMLRLAAVGLVAAPFVAARADLVLVSPNIVTVGGAGLGAVNTVLTLERPGGGTSETACVSFNGAGGDIIGTTRGAVQCNTGTNDAQTGNSQTQTRTLAEAGITSGSNFALFFNAIEPGGNAITLNSLVASFYNSTGQLVHTATYLGTPHDFLQTETGNGNAGYLFALTGAEQTAISTLITSLGAANIHVGIAASAGQVNGVGFAAEAGHETFFIFNNATTPTQVTPEPSSMALMATGLFGMVGYARRRRRNS